MRKLVCIALVFAAFGQEPIRVNTRLVQVVVIARDKRGAVGDLAKPDFELFDKGKPRPIAAFSVARASDRIQASPLPPNVYSNRFHQQSGAAEADPPVVATVILFDYLNTGVTDQTYARQQVLDFLKTFDPKYPTAIYVLANGLKVIQDFTEDRARLARTVSKSKTETSVMLANSEASLPRAGYASTASAARNLQPAFLAALNEPFQLYSLQRRVATTLSAMEAISNRLAGIPGRKNLIWVSGAFPLALAFNGGSLGGARGSAAALGPANLSATVTYVAEMRAAAQAIDRADVAVYPVDARGLVAGSSIRAANQLPYNQARTGATYNLGTVESLSGMREIDAMELLAKWTGGRAYFNNNDIRGAMKQATEDAEVNYTLGFYVEEKDLDGAYHNLKVKTSRKGVDLRHREGYFAVNLPDVTSQSAVQALKEAISGPVDSTGIGLTAAVHPRSDAPGTYRLTLAVDLQNLGLEEKDQHWIGNVSFLIVQQEASGLLLDSVGNTISIDVTEENRQKLMKDGVTLSVGITPAPGLSQIRVGVMDQGTGNVGTLRIVPKLEP